MKSVMNNIKQSLMEKKNNEIHQMMKSERNNEFNKYNHLNQVFKQYFNKYNDRYYQRNI